MNHSCIGENSLYCKVLTSIKTVICEFVKKRNPGEPGLLSVIDRFPTVCPQANFNQGLMIYDFGSVPIKSQIINSL